MAWWQRERLTLDQAQRYHIIASNTLSRARDGHDTVVAGATIVQGPGVQQPTDTAARINMGRALYRPVQEWQREVWDFYDTLGEFRQGITWKANMLSRVRIRAARKVPGQEPQFIDTGPAADLIEELGSGGGLGGHAQIMSGLAVFMGVPGESWLVGETKPDGTNAWYLRSIEEVRPSSVTSGIMSVLEPGNVWRELPSNSYVVRLFRPHKRFSGSADSPARACRPLLRELELVNRHIAAQYMSRLASSGLLVLPDEVTFPVRPEFQDAPDPFVAEFIEIAAEAVRTPGTAAAVVPIPLRMPGEYIDKVRHIDFTLKLDDTIISKRNSALARLAIELDMPPEALLGTSGVNHWNAWLIDEQGVKIHVAPDAELICDALTKGYLLPRLQAAGEPTDDVLIWYDTTDLVLRPDRSEAAMNAYDRMEITGQALRRELGFSEADKPSDDELRRMILVKAATQPVNTFAAMDELGLQTDHDTPPALPRPPAENPDTQQAPDGGRNTPDTAPSADVIDRVALTQVLVEQSKHDHGLRINMNEWTLLHPRICEQHLFSCPLTHAYWKPQLAALPGTSGTYRVWMNSYGQTIMGELMRGEEYEDMIPSVTRALPARRVG